MWRPHVCSAVRLIRLTSRSRDKSKPFVRLTKQEKRRRKQAKRAAFADAKRAAAPPIQAKLRPGKVIGKFDQRIPDSWQAVREGLQKEATRLGLGPTRITTANAHESYPKYEEWVARGYQGEMGYLAREDRLERRRDLNQVLPGVKAIVCTSLPYWPGRDGFDFGDDSEDKKRGIVSCYAWGEDYHEVFGRKLEKLAQWLHHPEQSQLIQQLEQEEKGQGQWQGIEKEGTEVDQDGGSGCGGSGMWYVDTGAVMERALAERAGLGFVGKNTLLISERMGSGLFLGEVLTTLPLLPDTPRKKSGACGKCNKCQVACPTRAFTEEYVLDARRCISYLTIELKGSIPLDLRPLMGSHIYGCDICQQVCPWNRFKWGAKAHEHGPGASPLFGKPAASLARPLLVELLLLDKRAFDERFRDSPIRRIGLYRLLRNVAVALGNSRWDSPSSSSAPVQNEAAEAIAALEAVVARAYGHAKAKDPDGATASEPEDERLQNNGPKDSKRGQWSMVAEHCEWAINRLRSAHSSTAT